MYPASSEILVMISFIVSILIVVSGWIFSKISKSSETVKRNVSFGMYIWGGVTTLQNVPQLWRIMNGTFEPAGSDLSIPKVEIFDGYVNFLSIIKIMSIGIGFLFIIVGLIYKKKSWSKIVIFLGVAIILMGLSQFLVMF